MTNPHFRLREFQASDSSAVAKLIAEFDGDLTTRFQVDPYEAIVGGTEFQTIGVVAECSGQDGIVGMGTLRFGETQYNGIILPFAFLDGLKVHQGFRGHGLGYQLARWRVERAREVYGDECVIATGMLYDNYASHAVASKWCREFAESGLHIILMPVRPNPPSPPSGIEVRELEVSQYEEFSAGQGIFYGNYNLRPPTDPASIAHALNVAVGGKKPYRYFVATDSQRNLLAGAQTWARGLLKADTVNDLPAPFRVMNGLFHLLPPDFTLRDINIGGLWYAPGHMGAARYLWEFIRWACQDQGTTVTAGFDPRDPLRLIPAVRPWHQPRPQITLALYGPTPLDRGKLLFGLGRV